MADTQTRPTGFGLVGVALAVGLSVTFVVLAIVASPLLGAAVVIPASIAVGHWRAQTLPPRIPHSLSVPVYSPTAVVHAPRVSASTGNNNVTTAA